MNIQRSWLDNVEVISVIALCNHVFSDLKFDRLERIKYFRFFLTFAMPLKGIDREVWIVSMNWGRNTTDYRNRTCFSIIAQSKSFVDDSFSMNFLLYVAVLTMIFRSITAARPLALFAPPTTTTVFAFWLVPESKSSCVFLLRIILMSMLVFVLIFLIFYVRKLTQSWNFPFCLTQIIDVMSVEPFLTAESSNTSLRKQFRPSYRTCWAHLIMFLLILIF